MPACSWYAVQRVTPCALSLIVSWTLSRSKNNAEQSHALGKTALLMSAFDGDELMIVELLDDASRFCMKESQMCSVQQKTVRFCVSDVMLLYAY